MQINTRDFGTMTVQEDQLVTFLQPLFGYEDLERYALLTDTDSSGLVWLQSVDRADICFVLLDPEEIGLPYTPDIGDDARRLLALDGAPCLYRLVAVVPDDFKDTTVNLKSPIVMNPAKGTAAQVILEADLPIRMRLFEGKGEEGLFVSREGEEC